MKNLRTKIDTLTRLLIFVPVAVMAWVMPPFSPAYATSPVINGGFDGSNGWIIVQNGGSGMSFNGELQFSYGTGEVGQSFNVNQGDVLEVSFTIDNSTQNSVGQGEVSDTWNASLISGSNATQVGRTVAHGQETFTLSLTVPNGATSATIGFSGVDNGFWAGVYGPVVDNVSAIITPAVTSLMVTSLADDGSEGTLRWAINQANTTSGGIHDAIEITTEGTITLTSDLPAITEGVTITGTGTDTTIVDGDNQWRSLNNNGTRTIAVSDMTFKRGKATNGGIGYTNNGGTFTFTRIKFTDMTSGSAWFQSNANVTTFTDSQFTYLYSGIKSDYGSTPSALSQTDNNYTNRIYVENSTFTNNTYGIYTERFVKINNSQFTNNTYGAVLRGLNRQQVINSVFTNNFVGVNFSSWIPTTWTPGEGNQTVSGSTFNDHATAIQFANNFNNGSTTHNGVIANSWSTSRNNSFSENTTIYGGFGFIEDGNTVVTTTTSTTTFSTTTTAPETTTTEPETTTTEPENVLTVPETTTTVPESPTSGTTTSTVPTEEEATVETPTSESYPEGDGPAASVPQYAPEQETTTQTNEPSIEVPTDTQDAADAAVADIFDGPMSDAGLSNAVDDLVTDAGTPEELAAVVNSLLDQELTDSQFSTVIDSVFDGPMSDENFSAAVDAVFADTSVLSNEQFDTAVQSVFDGTLSTEQFSDALDAIFDEPISNEKFDAIIDAVLDEPLSDEQFEELVGVLESDTVTEEQVSAAVDSIIESGVTEDQAVDLATSEKVLESINKEQATEIFDSIDVDALTDEAAQEIVDAVQDAPEEVRAAFEEEIDVFSGGFDEYVPTGSSISVEARRAVVAAGALVMAAPAIAGGAATGGTGSSPTGGGSSGGGGGSSGEVASEKKESSRRRRSSR